MSPGADRYTTGVNARQGRSTTCDTSKMSTRSGWAVLSRDVSCPDPIPVSSLRGRLHCRLAVSSITLLSSGMYQFPEISGTRTTPAAFYSLALSTILRPDGSGMRARASFSAIFSLPSVGQKCFICSRVAVHDIRKPIDRGWGLHECGNRRLGAASLGLCHRRLCGLSGCQRWR